MARPRKNGIDYFPWDVDVFSDKKIKILMAHFHSDGFTFYNYLLCKIYKEGYYLKIDDDFDYVASSELNMSYEKIGLMRKFLLERSMFDNKLFKSDNVLTSAGIQRRYQLAVKTRAVKNPVTVNERFWLLEKDETETFITVHPNSDYSEKNGDNSKKNGNESENYDIKESKVKESKVKESKVKKSKGESTSTCVDTQSLFDCQSVVDIFNDICGESLNRVTKLTDSRRRSIKRAYKELNGDFKGFFERVEKSDFLTGRNKRWTGCGFDWILKQENLIKILEGNFDNREDSSNGANTGSSKEYSKPTQQFGEHL